MRILCKKNSLTVTFHIIFTQPSEKGCTCLYKINGTVLQSALCRVCLNYTAFKSPTAPFEFKRSASPHYSNCDHLMERLRWTEFLMHYMKFPEFTFYLPRCPCNIFTFENYICGVIALPALFVTSLYCSYRWSYTTTTKTNKYSSNTLTAGGV